MFKSITILCLMISLINFNPCEAAGDDQPVTEKTRPAYIQEAIDKRFIDLSKREQAEWGANGNKAYQFCAIHEHQLLASLIKKSPTQKEFYVIDIGAGDYRWVDAVAAFINKQVKQNALPNDISVHVVGVGAEQYQTVEGKREDNCFIYKYGQIKIEEIDDELTKKAPLNGKKFDLVMSGMTLRHLVDSVGTFGRIYYNLLQTGGYFFFGKFFFLYENEDIESYLRSGTFNAEEHMITLLMGLKEPFLFASLQTSCKLVDSGHVLKKLKSNPPYALPWPYAGMKNRDTYEPLNSYSFFLVRFKNNDADKKICVPVEADKNVENTVLYGDKSLYDELNAFNIWQFDYQKVEWPYQPIPWL